MGFRFFWRPLGLAVAALSFPVLAAATFHGPSPDPTPQHGPTVAPQPQQNEQEQAPIDGVQRGLRPDSGQALRQEDSGQAIQEALVHSSLGLRAIQAGDLAQAQRELEVSLALLSNIPETAPLDGRRLKLIEETAALKAALSAASRDQDGGVSSQEDESDTDAEVSPDLVNQEEAPDLEASEDKGESVSEPDLSQFDVPIVLNEQVKAYIQFLQTRKWEIVNRGFQRSGRYLQMMREVFREKGLPLDLVNLAHIESAFNYRAYSRAQASGIWQFIKSTGQRFGMKISYYKDERRDPEIATRAAASYLRDLYRMFDSWPLALAAYNAGENRVQRAIDRQGTKDFWSLKLPWETQLFVPAFMAITIISKNPERYGFSRPVEETWEVEPTMVPGAVGLREIARAIDVDPVVMRDLNPALLRGITPPGPSRHKINLPPGKRSLLLANLGQLPRIRTTSAVARSYRVRRGDTLGEIASRYRTTPAFLAALNGLKVRDLLIVGKLLRLPQAKAPAKVVEASSAAPKFAATSASAPRPSTALQSLVHIVRRGDTLWGIAKAYAVTPEELRRWNDLGRRDTLQPGWSLRVASRGAATASRQGGNVVPAKTAQPVRVRYLVKRGDTLSGIARAHDVSLEELRRWNDLTHRAKLRAGQQLTIHVDKI